MDKKSLASSVEAVETPGGTARAFNILKLVDPASVRRLPFSIRVLLENAARHAESTPGALEAAEALARWPASVDEELPFMPYRVLLQDYTGVPLVVDLAAMRDAAKSAGIDPRKVNSGVPVDLVIDHSIQVDAWGNDLAFNVNLEKEYERNSERYSLLKWAQTAFTNMRVFPPGKGICHQFNLEYLSQVVATSDRGRGLEAFPDTLVGTDSHTTMVNGLGCLGWGVGGIEAEAVMLGEPYHMPIPRVLGVELKGALSEGVTPTDLVLAVTEKLRQKNVVGMFVEYFGEGYAQLSVPDRATLGNMSPEYGATAGYSPVDEATLAYLTGTARPAAHVEFVKRYAQRFGFFAGEDRPSYTDVVTVDLSKLEPSVAGPRNPEERRTLKSMPSFSHTLYPQRQSSSAIAALAGGSRSEMMLSEDGPFQGGMQNGSVVIAAITSCTNTSNPTVMVGAGMIAKKAVELGLVVKPWVKPSLAPGSTVVTDYLKKAGLFSYLDELGFSLVGYGCTTCIAQGTPVLLANGTSKPIEALRSGPTSIFGPTGLNTFARATKSGFLERGVRDCVSLVLQDGRELVCTPDHMVLTSQGRWVRADQLEIGRDRVVIGLEAPLDTPEEDERGYTLRAGDFSFNMDTERERSRTLAFARVLGYLIGDGSISALGQGRLSAGQFIDRETMLDDIELLTGLRPAANRYDERRWSVVLPSRLTQAFSSLAGVQAGRRIGLPPELPAFVADPRCPKAVVREFLAGLFGADGHSPLLHRYDRRKGLYSIGNPAFSKSTVPEYVAQTTEFVRTVLTLLSRCGVQTEGARISSFTTRRSESTYPPPKDGIPRTEVRLTLPDGLSFMQHVGYRYCVDKMLRGTAASVYWRLVDGIGRHRKWISERLGEIHQSQPLLSFTDARQVAVQSLLGSESLHDLPPVVSQHYSLLEGHDRFTRLPRYTDSRFRPFHRISNGFPSPDALLREIGARDWFGSPEAVGKGRSYCVEKDASTLPTLSLSVVERRRAGPRQVYDISVDELHAFFAGTLAVHNCIGNSGPLSPEVEKEIKDGSLYAVAVLSGNRNFDGRIHPLAKASFLMSPMLVVAYALAGRIDFDFQNDALGVSSAGKEVFLRDLWPSLGEVRKSVEASLSPSLFAERYSDAMKGDERWEALTSSDDPVYHWDDASTYIRHPGWFDKEETASAKKDITGARVLAFLEDKVTTDHISPAGTIPVDSPAGLYLKGRGVGLLGLSTYGSRRGNHDVMVRGGFSNIRLKNKLAKGKEGGFTSLVPEGKVMTIFDASVEYSKKKVPLIILAGKQYGAGSSRDWAAKAPKLLGVRAVIAENYERIHRSNLVAMGVLPLQFAQGESASSLGLTGEEEFDVIGLAGMSEPRQTVEVTARGPSGTKKFKATVRVDNLTEMKYVEHGGVLPYVFAKLHNSGH